MALHVLRSLFTRPHELRSTLTGLDTRFLPACQISLFSTSQKQSRKAQNEENSTPLPRLVYMQNPLKWFANQMAFRQLRLSLDPQFTEKEFARGARQAVSKVTQLISLNNLESLKPLLTKKALLNVTYAMELLWTDTLRRNIALNPQDVQLIIPKQVYFHGAVGKKFCDIDVIVIALKYVDLWKNGEHSSLFSVHINSRFHRDFTEGVLPEWTMAAFKVRGFNVSPPKPSK